MQIKAQFRCSTVTKNEMGQEIVKLVASNGPTSAKPNESWSKYTPSGEVSMTITQEGAQGAFVPGKEYALTFEPVG